MISFKLFDRTVRIKGIRTQKEADEISAILEKIIEEQLGYERGKIVADKILADREILGIVLKLARDYYKLKLYIEDCEVIIDSFLGKIR